MITVPPEQLKLAGDEPRRGWPPYSVLYPEGNAAEVIRGPVSSSENFLNSEASHGWVTRAGMDPLTAALEAAKAVMVCPGECRTLHESACLHRALTGRGFPEQELKERAARNGQTRHDWRLGALSGPNASGIYSQRASDRDAAPPGIRRADFREAMDVPRCPGQVGFPPSVAADTQLGSSTIAYRSAEALFGRCEGGGCILVLITGSRTREHK